MTRQLVRRSGLAVVLLGVGPLAGCGSAEPVGQVVAVVNGEDVTRRDLKIEASLVGGDASTVMQRVVDRKLLAQIAREGGAQNDPEYLAAFRLAREQLLIESLQRRTARAVRTPTKLEIDGLAETRPWAFRQRAKLKLRRRSDLRIFDVDTARLGASGKDIAGGQSMTIILAGQAYEVIGRTPIAMSEEDRMAEAKRQLVENTVDRVLSERLDAARHSSMIQYQPGFGPKSIIRTEVRSR